MTSHAVKTKFDEPIRENLASKPITWNQINNFIETKELYKLRRSKEETVKYHKHKDFLKSQNVSILDYILNKLDWTESEIDQLNNLQYATNQQRLKIIFTQNDLFKATINDFPYFYDKYIIHLLIWSKVKIPIYVNDTTDIDMFDTHSQNEFPKMNPSTKKKVENFLEKTLSKYDLKYVKDYNWFINYSNLQSVKAVSHVHLLIDCRSQEKMDFFLSELTKTNCFEPLE